MGRQAEIQKPQGFADRGIHTLVLGPPGVGKSHLLKLLQGEKLIRLPGLSPQRQAMLTLAEALYERGALKLRYDNEAGKGDHKHIGENELPYAFTTPRSLLEDFWNDVDHWRS